MQRSTSQAASTAPSSAAASSAPSSASGGPSPSDIREGDQAEELEQQQQSGLVTGLQGVLFTVSKEKDVSYGLAVFKLFADFLQLFLLMVTPKYGFDIKSNSKGWQIASVIGLNDFFAARGLTFFLAFLYVFVILLVGVVAMSIWVAWSFRSNRFDQVWPIVLLRWFSNIFFQVLDVASLSLFLITLNCQYFDVPPERQYHSVEFGVACFQLPHLIHAVVAVTSLVLFIAMATMVQLGEMDLNPVSRHPLAMAHSKVEVMAFGLRMGITLVNTLVTNNKWMASAQLIMSWCLFYIVWKWSPHAYAVVNYIRSGSYACIFFCATMLTFLQFLPNVDRSDPEAVYAYQQNITIGLWAGMGPAFLWGAVASWMRLSYFTVHVLRKFKEAPPGTRAKFIYRFRDPREVEIVARCCRKWVDEDTLDKESVELAEKVLRAGMSLLPKEPYMVILMSSFLIDVQGSYQSGYTVLQTAKKLRPNFLERFAIFAREQAHTQKASSGKTGQAADLVSYVEYMRNYRLALRAHTDALIAIKGFWKLLTRHDVSFASLANAVLQMDTTVLQAEKVYRQVLQRHVGSWRLMKMYARFLEVIKNDPWSASHWLAEGEELQAAEEEAKNNVFSDLDKVELEEGDGEDNEAIRKAKALRAQMEDVRAVVVINAKAIIQTVNQAACEIFGYAKNDMRGKNVRGLIPSPFADHHDQYVASYVATGKPSILDLTTEFVALHRERYVFAVLLTVTKISGVGEDSTFMGVVEPLPKSEDVAKCWVMATGSIISVDAVFSDWFAFKPEDLLGTYVSGLVVEGKKLEEFLKMVKAADRRFAGGVKDGAEGQSLRLDNIHIKHKFAEPMEVSLDVVNGGVGNHAFYVISVHRTGRHGRHMLVSDRRGRICHCTQELAATLGHTPHSIRMSGMQHALGQLLPEPFATLHKSYVHDSQPPLAPPYSCRAHLSVCMKVPGPEGDEHKPFKLDVKKREDLGGVNHIVNLEECTWEQALDERRLVLMTDPNGVVVKVSSSPFNLFGFEVSKLVGKSLADVVDGLAPGNHVTMLPRDPQLKAAALDTNKPDLAWTLMQLARRATSCPGCSWRVGVHPPEEHTLSTSHPGAGLLEQLHQRRTKPAVMVVKVHLGGALASRRASTLMPSAAIMPGSLTAEASVHGPSTVQLEVSLWRADMLSGVMELDSSGKIINVSEHKLYSPGLLWGVPSDTLVRKHISKMLPLADRPVVDLFEPGLGAYKAGAIRSKLKKSDKPVDGRLQKPGRVNLVKVKHLMDGAELELSVQAVYQWGLSGHVYLVIHCYNPRAAPDNLHELLSTPIMPANARALMNQPSYNARDKHQHKTSRSGTLLGLSGRNESNLTSDDVLGSRNVSGTPRGTIITPGPDTMGAKGVRWGAGQAPEEVVGGNVLEADEELSEAEDGVGHEDDDEGDDGHLHPPAYLENTKPNEGGELQHSGSGVASDEQGSQASGSQQGDDNGPQDDNTDYRRGTRFKKLQRLLASNAGQRMIQKFKIHSLGVVAAVACLHIGLFVLVLTQLSGQKGSVTTLNKIGFAARSAITAAIAVRDVELVLSGSTVPGLMDLSSYADLKIQLDTLHKEITNFQTLHTGTFLGFESPKQLPDVNGLYQLWNTPSVVYTQFQDNPVGPPSSSEANASLWDIGNDFVKKGFNVWANALNYTAGGRHLDEWSDVMSMLTNAPGSILPGYYLTLDALAEVVIEDAMKVKSLQLVLLLAEGLGAAVLVVCYMWIITTAVANQRFNLYSVFMVLPMGLVRSLANKELMIEDVEVEVNEDFADPDMAVNQFDMADEKGDEQANVATDNIIRINVAGLRLKHKAPWEQLLDMLMFWHPSKSGQDPDSGVRRVLQRSYTSMLRHCWLFMAWGLLIIVTNALGSQRLANISAPVSTFNACNFINIRYLRVFFTVQELANANTVASVEAIRTALGPRYELLDKEYQTMLYGAKAFPNETASHYTRVVGVLYAAGSGVDLLYRTRQCQNQVASSCFAPGHPLYEMSHRGTDLMMQTFFTAVETSIMSQDMEPSLDSDIFSTVWNMRGDTSGGLSNINKQYEASVLAVFDFVIAVHVVGLVLTLLLLLAYLAFVLKPYLKETANEVRRLAELLTQLPNEVDVEGLLRASLLRLPPSNRNAKGSDADVKRPRGSLESPGGSRNLTSLDLAEGLKQTGSMESPRPPRITGWVKKAQVASPGLVQA